MYYDITHIINTYTFSYSGPFNGITSTPDFVKMYQSVQKSLQGTQTENCNLMSPFVFGKKVKMDEA